RQRCAAGRGQLLGRRGRGRRSAERGADRQAAFRRPRRPGAGGAAGSRAPGRRQSLPRRAAAAGGDRPQAGRRPADPQRERPRRAGALRPAPARQGLRPHLPRQPAADAPQPRTGRRAGLLRGTIAGMNLLAVETSTEACSVALWREGEVFEKHELAPRRHTQLVLPWIEQLLAGAGLARSQLDVLAVGRGPGAFTGVRLGIAIVQGLALALERPVVPVSTLAVLAMRAPAEARDILAAIDARMGEVYLGAFRRGGGGLVQASGPEQVLPPGLAPLPAGPVHGVGSGFG